MTLFRLLAITPLIAVLSLGPASQSFGNEKNNGTGGGIGGTGHEQTMGDLLLKMNDIGVIPCEQESSIGSIEVAQGPSIKNKQGDLICDGFEIKTAKDEFVSASLKVGITLQIPGGTTLSIRGAQGEPSNANANALTIQLVSGKIRIIKNDFGKEANSLQINTLHSNIDLSGLDAEVILKPESDNKYMTYVRSYAGASWLSIGNKKLVIPMGYIGISNEDLENPFIEVKKDAGQLGLRTPKNIF